MRLTIISWTGKRAEGIVLSSRGLTLRVAVWGSDDAEEFRFRGGQWFAENGEPVQIAAHGEELEPEVDCGQAFGGVPKGCDAPAWLN